MMPGLNLRIRFGCEEKFSLSKAFIKVDSQQFHHMPALSVDYHGVLRLKVLHQKIGCLSFYQLLSGFISKLTQLVDSAVLVVCREIQVAIKVEYICFFLVGSLKFKFQLSQLSVPVDKFHIWVVKTGVELWFDGQPVSFKATDRNIEESRTLVSYAWVGAQLQSQSEDQAQLTQLGISEVKLQRSHPLRSSLVGPL